MIKKLGFIGCGNMASAIIKGIIGNNIAKSGDFYIFDTNTAKLDAFCAEIGGANACASAKEVQNCADITFLCVKPNVIAPVCGEFSAENKAFVSIAAGVKYEKLLSLLPKGSRLLRIMPNTPLMQGKGASCFQIPSSLAQNELNFVENVFSALGIVVKVDGGLMDAATGISGSGPAYVYYFIDAMAKAGERSGLSYADSLSLTLQTIEGAVKMVKTSEKSVEQLKIDVCSPGGTTIEALAVFDERKMADTISAGIDACIAKSHKLSE